MPLLHSPFRGPGTNIPPEPQELLPPQYSPQTINLGTIESLLPGQAPLTTTVITFTRPDGAQFVTTSVDTGLGFGFVYPRPDGSTIIFVFDPGVLNQGGDWQFSIFDPTVMTQPETGTFHVPGPGPHPDPLRPIPDPPPLQQRQKDIAAHKIVAFDDSSSIYTSESPSTFFQTPDGTLGDEWSDMTIAVNDEEYDLIALWDADAYAGLNPPANFDGFRGGVLIMQPGQNDPSVLPILSYTAAPVDGVTWTEAWSGAISSNGTLLACIAFCGFASVPVMYPRISRDFGQTWADVTGLPPSRGTEGAGQDNGQQWTKACFGQNAQIMYIHRSGDYIYKSIDSGVTWNALTNGPTWATNSHGYNPPDSAPGALRLRCSQDGSVIAGIAWDGQFYVSTNGGMNWSHTDFITLGGIGSHLATVDFGMPIDGSKFLVAIGFRLFPAPATGLSWSSTDGINWTDRTIKLPAVTNANAVGGTPTNCGVSPNGENAVVLYAKNSNSGNTLPTDGSYAGPWHTDRGSWLNDRIDINLVTGGKVVAAHIVPM